MKALIVVTLLLTGLGLSACSSSEESLNRRGPLLLGMGASPRAVQATERGRSAYRAGRYDEARIAFEQAVAMAQDSGEARYNLGLALFAMGNNEAANRHFKEAANLAPGNKAIWDSPLLSPHGKYELLHPKKTLDLPTRGM